MRHPGHDPREREDDDERKKLEQEAKLKQILKENEELQKDIADVSTCYKYLILYFDVIKTFDKCVCQSEKHSWA